MAYSYRFSLVGIEVRTRTRRLLFAVKKYGLKQLRRCLDPCTRTAYATGV